MFTGSLASRTVCFACRLHLLLNHSIRLRQPLKAPLYSSRRHQSNRTHVTRLINLIQSHEESSEPNEERVIEARAKWGDFLPDTLLNSVDLRLYKSLYGPPLKMLSKDEANQYLQSLEVKDEEMDEEDQLSESADGTITVTVTANSAEEAKQYRQLRKDMQKAMEQNASDELIQKQEDREDEEEDVEGVEEELAEEGGSRLERYHPLTLLGQYNTNPSTVFFPQKVQESLQEVLAEAKSKHLREAAQSLEPPSIKTGKGNRKILPAELNPVSNKMSTVEAQVFLITVLPEKYATTLATLTECRRRLGGQWVRSVKRVLDVGAGGAGILAWKSIVEAERNGQEQLKRESQSEIQKGEAEGNDKFSMPKWWYEEDRADVQGADKDQGFRASVVAGSYSLRSEINSFLESTALLPRIPDSKFEEHRRNVGEIKWSPLEEEVNLRQPNNPGYDLIVATDSLVVNGPNHLRRNHVQHLWSLLNPDGGVLLLLESGTTKGFEAIAGAREQLLKNNIRSPEGEGMKSSLDMYAAEKAENHSPGRKIEKEEGMIIAPCTNHRQCPMFTSDQPLPNRKDVCQFYQRWQKPASLRAISGSGSSDKVDSMYSYLAVRRGNADLRPAPPPLAASKEEAIFEDVEISRRTQYRLDILEAKIKKDPSKAQKLEKKMKHIIEKAEKERTAITPLLTHEEMDDAIDAESLMNEETELVGEKGEQEVEVEGLEGANHGITAQTEFSDYRPDSVIIADEVIGQASPTSAQRYMLTMPRIINKPIKAKGHIVLDVCTHSGTLERWTVPKSYSKTVYHDVRKSQWGDLWALGAKTKVQREAKEGKLRGKPGRGHVIINAAKENISWAGDGGRKGKYAGKERSMQSRELKRQKAQRNAETAQARTYRKALKRKDKGDEDWHLDEQGNEIAVPKVATN